MFYMSYKCISTELYWSDLRGYWLKLKSFELLLTSVGRCPLNEKVAFIVLCCQGVVESRYIYIFFLLYFTSRERRRRRSVKCTEIKHEATQLLDVLGNIMKSCKHPQLLENVTSKMVERGRQSLTKAVTDLDHMIHNQSATNERVRYCGCCICNVYVIQSDCRISTGG